jgi:hypothetical protein
MAKKERTALKARKTRPLHVCNVSIFAQREFGSDPGKILSSIAPSALHAPIATFLGLADSAPRPRG